MRTNLSVNYSQAQVLNSITYYAQAFSTTGVNCDPHHSQLISSYRSSSNKSHPIKHTEFYLKCHVGLTRCSDKTNPKLSINSSDKLRRNAKTCNFSKNRAANRLQQLRRRTLTICGGTKTRYQGKSSRHFLKKFVKGVLLSSCWQFLDLLYVSHFLWQ